MKELLEIWTHPHLRHITISDTRILNQGMIILECTIYKLQIELNKTIMLIPIFFSFKKV